MTELKYYDAVLEAARPLKEWLSGADNGDAFTLPAVNAWRDGTAEFTTARLRLDWEISDIALEDTHDPEELKAMIAELLVMAISADVADLIENGDTDNFSDALYKTIDGAVKRGKEPVHIEFFSNRIFWEYKTRKKSTEYTLYTLVAIDWTPEDVDADIKRKFV